MSKFKIGDRIKVVQMTDLDADLDDPNRVIKDQEANLKLYGGVGPAIGEIGTVTEVWCCDYYTVSAAFPSSPLEEFSFIDDDLELVAE